MALERRTQKEPCMGHDSPALTRACPMQILSVPSTETAKKAALITQRTAMINEGKAVMNEDGTVSIIQTHIDPSESIQS